MAIDPGLIPESYKIAPLFYAFMKSLMPEFLLDKIRFYAIKLSGIWLLVCMLSIVFVGHVLVSWALEDQRIPITGPFTHRSGLAFYTPLADPTLGDHQKPVAAHLYQQTGPLGSVCTFLGPVLFNPLCPDVWRELGPGHSLHDEIERAGDGRFSVWQGFLIFSTLTRSPPDVNTQYLLVIDKDINTAIAIITTAMIIINILFFYCRKILCVNKKTLILMIIISNFLFSLKLIQETLIKIQAYFNRDFFIFFNDIKFTMLTKESLILSLEFIFVLIYLIYRSIIRKKYDRQTAIIAVFILGVGSILLNQSNNGTAAQRLVGFSLALAIPTFLLLRYLATVRGLSVTRGLSLLAGLAIPLLSVPSFMTAMEWVRPLEVEQIRLSLARGSHDKPVLLLLGSSLTNHAVDPVLLESTLTEAGHPMEVLSLSWGGMSLLMRDYQLRQLLENTHIQPALTLMEVSGHYDLPPGPIHLFNISEGGLDYRAFSADWRVFTRALTWLATEDRRPWRQRLANALTGFDSLLNHYLHPGFLANHAPINPAYPRWHPPPCAAQTAFDQTTTPALVEQSVHAFKKPLKRSPDSPWIRQFLIEEIDQLKAANARDIAFFSPPILIPHYIDYARHFCDRHRERSCLLPFDPALYRQLSTPGQWSDRSHLCASGRSLYTAWLAQTLLHRFTLP